MTNLIRQGGSAAVVVALALFVAACAGLDGASSSAETTRPADADGVVLFRTVDVWNGDSLATMSPPALAVEVTDVEYLTIEGSIAVFRAEVSSVLYADSTRSEIEAPDGVMSMWANLNTIWGAGTDVVELTKSLPPSAVLLLGYQDIASYDDLRSSGPYSIMAILGLYDSPRFVGPGVESLNADLGVLLGSWSGTTAELISELAVQLRLREDAISTSGTTPSLSLIDQLVEPQPTPEEAYLALAPDERDVLDAPEAIRATLVEREVFLEVTGGAGDDAVAIGVQSDAGWSGGAVSSIQGATWPGLFDPNSSIRVLLYDFGPGERAALVLYEIEPKEWQAAAGVYIRVPVSAIQAYRDGASVRMAEIEVSLLDQSDLGELRSHVTQLGNDSGGEIDREPLPSETVGVESTDENAGG